VRLLGAILAGGQSRRFGSDKAMVLVAGVRLMDRVAQALAQQCDSVVVCGREEAGFASLGDLPETGLGPLGGLNAALHHAAAEGYDAVLSSGCDVPNLPADLAQQLAGDGAAHASEQPVVGLWPAALASRCSSFLQSGGRSLYGFGEHVGARLVAVSPLLRNVNSPEDLGLPEIQ
jgi:molybdopterin-guanine dinucleotide biosynthesis protein A